MKNFFSIILCAAVLLTSGCSGVSQEEYNSLVEENSKLKSDCETALAEKNNIAKELAEAKSQSNIDGLKNELETLKTENVELESELKSLQSKSDKTDYCFDIQTWMLGRPQSTIAKNEVEKFDDNVDLETTYYMEKSKFTVKMVHTIKETLSPVLTAAHIAGYEKATANGIENLLDDQMNEYIIIYRHSNGNVILSSFWYIDDNNEIQYKSFATRYSSNAGVLDEYQKMIG